MRCFEKISFEQFRKDISDNINLYNKYSIPSRGTKNSAGYDFYSIEEYIIKPNETKVIPMGIKASMNSDEVLYLIVRSSMGFKYNVRLCNQVGVIDSDYYDNDNNEGHIWIKLENHGTKDFKIEAGDRICQGVFMKYLTVDNEEEIIKDRAGGIGSTDEEEKYE